MYSWLHLATGAASKTARPLITKHEPVAITATYLYPDRLRFKGL